MDWGLLIGAEIVVLSLTLLLLWLWGGLDNGSDNG